MVSWSESLNTNHEVPGSIPGSTVGIFPEREDFHGDHGLGRLVEFRFKDPPGATSSYITTHIIGKTSLRLMGVPNSEVGYTPAMPRREDHEVHKDMWWHWGRGESNVPDDERIYPKHVELRIHQQNYFLDQVGISL